MMRLRCLRRRMSWWVEPGCAGWWKWVMRNRWGRVIWESESEWPAREEAIAHATAARAQAASAPIVVEDG